MVLEVTYSIVRKGHKTKPEQINGDYFLMPQIFYLKIATVSSTAVNHSNVWRRSGFELEIEPRVRHRVEICASRWGRYHHEPSNFRHATTKIKKTIEHNKLGASKQLGPVYIGSRCSLGAFRDSFLLPSKSFLLCISTSFWVLHAPKSWLIYFFWAVFNLYCKF